MVSFYLNVNITFMQSVDTEHLFGYTYVLIRITIKP